MQYYSHKKNIVHIERVEEDGFLHTVSGSIPVFKGKSLIATDEYGCQTELSEEYFRENYVAVQKIETKAKVKTKSPFELAYEKQLQEFSLPNQVEDEEYISGTLSKVKY